MIPPLVIIALGVNPTYALVMSQVVLSFGIAFALVPLIMFTSSKKLWVHSLITASLPLSLGSLLYLLSF